MRHECPAVSSPALPPPPADPHPPPARARLLLRLVVPPPPPCPPVQIRSRRCFVYRWWRPFLAWHLGACMRGRQDAEAEAQRAIDRQAGGRRDSGPRARRVGGSACQGSAGGLPPSAVEAARGWITARVRICARPVVNWCRFRSVGGRLFTAVCPQASSILRPWRERIPSFVENRARPVEAFPGGGSRRSGAFRPPVPRPMGDDNAMSMYRIAKMHYFPCLVETPAWLSSSLHKRQRRFGGEYD